MKHLRSSIKTSKLTTTAGAAIVVSLSVMTITPARAVSSSGNAEANIVSLTVPALTEIDDLDFGEVISGGGPGTVAISTAGVPTLAGVSQTPSSPHHQGIMRIIGDPGRPVDISMAAPSYPVNNGAFTMNVNNFDLGGGPNNAHTVTVGGAGTIDVNIGATLNVGAGQQIGTYTGSYTLNADYQ